MKTYLEWRCDILAIRKQVSDAEALNWEGKLSNSQLKKVKAKAYNEEREYLINNPKPVEKIKSVNGIGPVALLHLISRIGRK